MIDMMNEEKVYHILTISKTHRVFAQAPKKPPSISVNSISDMPTFAGICPARRFYARPPRLFWWRDARPRND